MSFHTVVNGSIPLTSRSYLDGVQLYLPSTSRLALIALINTPILIILLNALWQWIGPRDRSVPPVVFHWLPIIGSAIEYGNDPINFFFRCREKYGDVFTFILFGRRMTMALGTKGNDFIFGGKASVLSAEDAYTHLTTPIFGKDVVYDVPNEVLMEQKRFVKVSLSMDKFRSYVGMIEDEVDEFMKHDPTFKTYQMNDINEWGSFEADDLLQNITILTASRTLQGKEVRGNLDKSFAQLYTDLDGGFTPINFLFPNLPLESYRKRDRAHQKMSAFYVDCIKKRRADPQNSDPDIISSLLNQTYRDGRPLKDHEVAHIMIALLMAGQHTSSASGSWTLMHLAANPDVAEALYQEQLKYFQTPDGKLRSMTYEEMRDLPLLDSVIRETLRVHPPIHSIIRAVRDDIPVPPTLSAPSKDGTYVIPKGYFLIASPAVSQMDPELWVEPLKWNPYRWSDPEGAAAQASKAYSDEHGEKIDYGFGLVSKGTGSHYQPFGAGRHRCIGEQFAYLQLGTVMISIIRKIEMRMEKLPDHNYHVIDIGCGEGSLLNVLSQPAPWLLPPDLTIHHIQSTPSPKDEIKNLHLTHVVGLDISSPDLLFATQVTAPTPPSPDTGVRWEPLEVKIWNGGLESFNPEFVGVECIVSTEVIEHLQEDILQDFAPILLGVYHPLFFLCTTPSYTFNARFTAPDTQEARRTGYPDPTGRTKRVFRHVDHKFEWTLEEFKDWCQKAAEEWGYEVHISSIGRALEVDLWGRDEELGGATQVAEFKRKDSKEHQEIRDRRCQPVKEKAAARAKHNLLVTHHHLAHSSAQKPAPLSDIGERVKAKMEEYREGFMILEEIWFTQEIAILCGGWIEVLVNAINAHEKLVLHNKEDTETRSWQVELKDGVLEPNTFWPLEGETSQDHIPLNWLPEEDVLSPCQSDTDGIEGDVSWNNSDIDADSERAQWGSAANSAFEEDGGAWGGSSESEGDDPSGKVRWDHNWNRDASKAWSDDPDEPEATSSRS